MYKFLPILLFAYGLAVSTEDIYDNSYALIIGIDKYENVQNLNYAVKDAESIQDILVNTFDFPEDNVRLLKNEEANKDAILKAFSDITTKAEDKDRVLIYFAGHGDTYDLPDGGEMGYLLPVDGNNDDLFLSSIAMDDLKRISLMSKAKHLLYLVDACYGGLLTIGARGFDSQTTPNYIDKITKNKSRQIITAGGRGEEVIEKSEWGHSAFTLNLNRGLKDGNADYNADGYITANELGMFLSEKVTIDSHNQQTPQYGRMTSQEGEFVFVYADNTTVIQDKSADAKLDLVLSEIDTLESQESSDDGRILARTFSEYGRWVKKYKDDTIRLNKPETFGIHYTVCQHANGAGFSSSIGANWIISFTYFPTWKNDLLKRDISPQEFLPITTSDVTIGLGYVYSFTDEIFLMAIGGLCYIKTSWQNIEKNTSEDVIKITPQGGVGISIRPLPGIVPPLIINLDLYTLYKPSSFNETDGIIKLDNWQFHFSPGIAFSLVIPKYLFSLK
jgi:hypothetical protein